MVMYFIKKVPEFFCLMFLSWLENEGYSLGAREYTKDVGCPSHYIILEGACYSHVVQVAPARFLHYLVMVSALFHTWCESN